VALAHNRHLDEGIVHSRGTVIRARRFPSNGLEAFHSEAAPQPAGPTPSLEPRVLMSVVDAYPRKDSYKRASSRAREVRRPITVRRLAAWALRAARAAALFPFLVAAWFLVRIWWLARLLVTATLRAAISAPVSVVRFVLAAVAAMLTPPARRRESPGVVRVAIVGVPAWARHIPLVPIIAVALGATAGISVALSLLLLRP